MIEEPYWGGSKVNLIDKFNYGRYKFEVYDIASNLLLYSRGYSTIFNEWQTTEEAKHTTRTFSETVIFPFPKNSVIVKFYASNRKNKWIKKFEYEVNPENYFIKTERVDEYKNFEVLNSGDPSVKVDIVIIPEGYTEEEMDDYSTKIAKNLQSIFSTLRLSENTEISLIFGVLKPIQWNQEQIFQRKMSGKKL